MDSSSDNLFSKKNLISYLIMAILIVAIPVAVKLVQTQQQLKSKAAEAAITVLEDDNTKCPTQDTCTTSSTTVQLKLTSSFGTGGTTQTSAGTTGTTSTSFTTSGGSNSGGSGTNPPPPPPPPPSSTVTVTTEAAKWYVYLKREDIRDLYIKSKGEAAGGFDYAKGRWVEYWTTNMDDWWNKLEKGEKQQFGTITAYATSLGIPNNFPSGGYPANSEQLVTNLYNQRSDLQADAKTWFNNNCASFPNECNIPGYMSAWLGNAPKSYGGDWIDFFFAEGWLPPLPSTSKISYLNGSLKENN